MRLLHPRTIQILAEHADELPRARQSLAHCWAEIFKWKSSGKKHPKQFIDDDRYLGSYLGYLYEESRNVCKLDAGKIPNLGVVIAKEFILKRWDFKLYFTTDPFCDPYLFSDACSLYFKGCNVFPYIFGYEWKKFVPVESLEEILRQVTKTLKK